MKMRKLFENKETLYKRFLMKGKMKCVQKNVQMIDKKKAGIL